MIKLYGTELSTMVNKVRFVAHYLGVPYEFVPVNLLAGDHQTKEYLQINPSGKVPAIIDDDFSLSESNAIIRYLAEKNSSSIYPKGLRERAEVDRWIDFVSLHIGTAMGRVFYNRVIVHALKGQVDENSLSDGVKFLKRFLPIVDHQLSEKEYLTGSQITLADFNLLSQLDPAEACEIDLNPYSNIVIWRKKLTKNEFYTKCYASYTELIMSMQEKK